MRNRSVTALPMWRDLVGTAVAPSDLLKPFGMLRVPVPVFTLPMAIGIRALPSAGLPENVAGELLYEGSGSPALRFNVLMPGYRQRFTVAHLLGHALLHLTPGIASDVEPETDYQRSLRDFEANAFASELLMPDELLELHGSRVGFQPSRLGPLFYVTERVMTWRLARYLDAPAWPRA